MDNITGTPLRVLIELEKRHSLSEVSRGNIKATLNIEGYELDAAEKILKGSGLTESTMTGINISSSGKVKLKEHLHQELNRFCETMENVSYEFALLEFIINRKIVAQSEFPLELIDFLPAHQRGNVILGSVIQVLHDNANYYANRNDGIYLASPIGESYYSRKIKEIEQLNAPSPPQFIFNRAKIGDTYNLRGKAKMNKDIGNYTENNTTTTSAEDGSKSLVNKVKEWFLKPIVKWLAVIFIAGVTYLTSVQTCRRDANQSNYHKQPQGSSDTTSRKK